MASLSLKEGEESKDAPTDMQKSNVLDLTPLHQGELPVLQKFLSVVSDLEDQSLWDSMLDEFGKYKVLNLKLGGFINYSYSTVTRMIKVLDNLGLSEQFDEQLQRLKRDVGKRFPILLLHDIGGTLIYRDKKQPVGPNGETNEDFLMNKNRFIYVRPGASEYVKRLQSHPRVIFGFYSSMIQKNVDDVLKLIKSRGVDFGNYEVFD